MSDRTHGPWFSSSRRVLGSLAPLALAATLVLAGCSGTFAGGASDSTPTAVTVTPAPVPTATLATYPPGVSGDGVTDASALRRARFDALSDTQYLERATTRVRVDGETVFTQRFVSRHGEAAHAVGLTRTTTVDGLLNDSVVRAAVWTNGSYTVQRIERAGRTRFEAREYTSGLAREPQLGYVSALSTGATTVTDRRVVDGTTRYTLVTTGLGADGPWFFESERMALRGPGRARTLVTEAGVVTEFVAEFPVRIDGRNGTLSHTYRASRGVLSVDRPAWFDEAVADRSGSTDG